MLHRSPEEIQDFLARHRREFATPHVYFGNEVNTFHKPWNSAVVKILIAGLWRYEDFRGNQTLPLLYQMLNEWGENVVCERAHFPNTEDEYHLFRKYRIPLFGLESKHEAGEYDIIMTSLSFLPNWFNFPLMLKMSGIPVLWRDRKDEDKHPLLMVGGSAMYGNFCITYPVVDIIYFGDAEEEDGRGLFSLLNQLIVLKNNGLSNSEILDGTQPYFPYIFCPRFYTPIYDKEKFLTWRVSPSAFPRQFYTHKCKDLDKAPKYTRPILSYTDTTMGLGEIEVSRGCRGFCAFCGIGWKYRPYRERSCEVMVDGMRENKKNSGASSLCPIATEFAYYSEKRRLVGELSKISRFVDPLSMRVDAFASDPEFDRFLSTTGMNQLALGVEAVSQRLRNRLMKGITEEEILKACRIAMESGKFRRIKFFMISNIDEELEDFEEFFLLLKEVNRMREYYKKHSSLEVVASWTPLFVEPCTPLQWKKPTIGQKKDWKMVDARLRELGIGFKLGIKNAEDFLYTMQGMHLGDTRFAEAVAKASEEIERPFYVSFSKQTKKAVTRWMEKMGISWDYVLRERAKDEVFPWDCVDRGAKKEVLWGLYTKLSKGDFDAKPKKINPQMDNYVLPTSLFEEQDARLWWLVTYQLTNKEYQTIPNTYWKAAIQAVANQVGFPLATNRLHFLSDRDNGNWYYGVDYLGMGLREEPTNTQQMAFFDKLREAGLDFLSFVRIEPVRGYWQSLASSYIVETDSSLTDLAKYLTSFNSASSVIVRAKQRRYFSGEWKEKIDLKKIFFKIADVTPTGTPLAVLSVVSSHTIGIRDALRGVFTDMSSRHILKFDIQKVGLHIIDKGEIKEEH